MTKRVLASVLMLILIQVANHSIAATKITTCSGEKSICGNDQVILNKIYNYYGSRGMSKTEIDLLYRQFSAKLLIKLMEVQQSQKEDHAINLENNKLLKEQMAQKDQQLKSALLTIQTLSQLAARVPETEKIKIAYQQGDTDKAEQLYNHLLVEHGKSELHSLDPKTQAQLLASYSQMKASLSQNEAALQLLEEAVKLDPGNIEYQWNLGWNQIRLGNYQGAVKTFEAIEATPSLEQVYAIGVENALGITFHQLGNYKSAMLHYQKSLDLQQHSHGNDMGKAVTQQLLASLYQAQGNYKEAERFYTQSLKVFELQLPPNHSYIADSYYHLGTLAQEHGDTLKAEKFYLIALDKYKQGLSNNHPSLGNVYYRLGSLAQSRSEFAEAEKDYAQALSIYNASLPSNHPYIAGLMHQQGTLAQAQGKTEEAKALYEKALQTFKMSLPSNHINIGNGLYRLGTIAQTKKQYPEAEAYYQQALSIYQANLKPDHSLIAGTIHQLGTLAQAQGDNAKAQSLYHQALQKYSSKNSASANTYYRLATVEEAQKHYQQAEGFYKEALGIYAHKLPEAQVTRKMKSDLQGLYIKMGYSPPKAIQTVDAFVHEVQ